MKRIFNYWIPLYLYAGVIFFFSSVPRPLPETSIPSLDKILHVCAYAIFGILAARAFKNSPRKTFLENFKVWAIIVSIMYGISDEIHQAFVPLRQCSIFDMVADGAGGIIGAFIYGKYNTV